jgi:RND family efflux transporter MFP subunit
MMKPLVAAMVLAGWSGMGTNLLWAAESVELSTRVSGVVEKVWVKPGQRVKKGASLLRLDRTVLQAQLAEATAEQARAQADAGEARRERDRAQELFNRTVSSTSEFDAAKLLDARAQATLAVAQARRVIAQKNWQDAELKAPFDGVVSAVPGGLGTVVSADCQPRPLVIFSAQP